MSLPPPGWYPDPSGYADARYWNGRTWTEWTQPAVDRVSAAALTAWATGSGAPSSGQTVVFRSVRASYRASSDFELLDVVGQPVGRIVGDGGTSRHASLVAGDRLLARFSVTGVGTVHVEDAWGRPVGVVRRNWWPLWTTTTVEAGGYEVARFHQGRRVVAAHASGAPVAYLRWVTLGAWPANDTPAIALRVVDGSLVPPLLLLAVIPSVVLQYLRRERTS
ncbi:MAG: DUF2510 domain-containing protein [Kineosporiaceae bacterium]